MRVARHHLIQQIHRIEQANRQVDHKVIRLATAWVDIDIALGGGLLGGTVHEWFACEPEQPNHTPNQTPTDHWQPAMTVLVHLAKRALLDCAGGVGGGGGGWAVWVGRRCWPHGHSLADGLPGMLQRSLLVNADDCRERWWAVDLTARSRAVSVVIADGSGLDMSHSRRLQLAAEAGGAIILLARPVQERSTISAATTRWTLTPTVSDTDRPRWRVELWRCKGTQRQTGTDDPHHQWFLEAERKRGRGLVVVSAEPGDRSAVAELASSESQRKRA